MAANDNAQSCGKEFTLLDLLASILGKDASGKVLIRTHKVTSASGVSAFSCGNPVTEDEVIAAFKSAICLDGNGDFALRISQST